MINLLNAPDAPSEPQLDGIVALAATHLEAPAAFVSIVEARRQWIARTSGLDIRHLDKATGFCAHAMRTEDVFVVLDASLDPRFASDSQDMDPPGTRFYAGAPLVLAGERVGTLGVISPEPRDGFGPEEAQALMLVAAKVVEHLELRQLRHSTRIAQMIAQTTSDAFVCADNANRIIHWSPGAEAMLGWTAAEALGQSLSMIVPERFRAAHETGLRRVAEGVPATRLGKVMEVLAVTRDGREFPIELSLSMWRTPQGTPDGFASVMRDITARKTLEAEREAATSRLAEQVDAMEASQDGIAITDADGHFIFMNTAHATMFGHSVAGLLGKPWQTLYGAAEAERIGQSVFPLLLRNGRWRGRAVGRHVDGGDVPQEVSLSLSEKGGIVCTTRDIGTRLAEEREKALLREQLLVAQKQEAVGQLASGLAHDFNNLIAAISGSAALLSANASPDVRRHAERIEVAAGAAGSLVHKLLSVGRRQPHRQEIDLRSILTDVADLLRVSLPPMHRLQLALPEEPVVGMLDSTELMQVLLNLGINARDALGGDRPRSITMSLRAFGKDEPPGAMLVGVAPAGAAALITVEDDGCGMPPEDLKRIFQPFFSRKGDKGTGLGLPMVAGIVSDIGGGIAVDSEVGIGTSFRISWPLRPEAARASDEVRAAAGVSIAGRMILVVDDDDANLEFVASVLEKAGAEVGSCSSAADALEALEEHPDAWDLMITDYHMPQMDGRELARRCKARWPALPILLCSGMQNPEVLGPKGFDAVLRKPVAASMLVRTCASLLSQRLREADACES